MPAENMGSKEDGEFIDGTAIDMPANSIVTVAFATQETTPTFNWINPINSTIWETASTQKIEWNSDSEETYAVTLCWNPTVAIKDVSASSEWTTEDGTFSWKASNVLSKTSGRWGAQGNSDEWIELNLEEECEISGIIIDETQGIGCSINSYEIQYYSENEWKVAKNGTSLGAEFETRSEERRVGKECVVTCRECGSRCYVKT